MVSINVVFARLLCAAGGEAHKVCEYCALVFMLMMILNMNLLDIDYIC